MLNLSSPPELRQASSARSSDERIDEQGAARVGQTLMGKWTLDAVLGSGGTATVYAATHRNGNRVAVKVLHPHFSEMPAERERFSREGFFANKVEHPDAVHVLDEDVDEEGRPFLVMELLEGEPLVARWKAAGYRLPVPETLWIADRLLGVLEAAHAHGVVHRDIKPENLFLTAVGGLKVLDFGIARLGGMGSGTVRGIVLGTPGFTAPEQARGEWDIVGARTDIWAVGATLFALLTGRLVHEEQQTAAHLLRVSMEPVPPIRQIEPDVPDAVARVIDRALSFSPQERFASAAEMRQSIAATYRLTTGQNLGEKRPGGAVADAGYAPTLRVTTGTTVVHRTRSAPRAAWRDRWDTAAMATAFFALGGIVVGYFASRQDPAAAVEETTLVAPAAALVSAIPTSSATGSESTPEPRLEPESPPVATAPVPLTPAPDPPPAAPVVKNAAVSTPAALTVPVLTRPRTERHAVTTGPRAPFPSEAAVPDLHAPMLPAAVTALPPAALQGSASKRPPRAPPAGDNFDFVETRR